MKKSNITLTNHIYTEVAGHRSENSIVSVEGFLFQPDGLMDDGSMGV